MLRPSPTAVRVQNLLGTIRARRRGVAAALHGPAGIGKTYTGEWVLTQLSCRSQRVQAAASWPALLAALPHEAAVPLWVQETLCPRRPEPPSSAHDLAAAVAAQLAAHAPFVLLADDLHEADGSRQAFWAALAEAVRRSRGVGLLVTSRARPPAAFTRLAAAPLEEQAALALLEAEVGSELPLMAQRFVIERAGGNALFLREYLRLLLQRGHLWSDGRTWHWRAPSAELLPQTIEAVLAEWLELQATRTGVQLLAARTLLGSAASETAWRELSCLGSASFSEERERLERAGLLSGTELGHPLFGEVALAELPPEERRALCTRAVQQLAHLHPVQAARWLPDALLPPVQAANLLERAAETLRRAHDLAGAARQYLAAARQHSGPPRAALCERALAALGDFQGEEVQALVELGEQLSPEASAFLLARARLHGQAGRPDDAERLLTRLGDGPEVALERLRLRHHSQNPAGVLSLWNARPDLHGQPEARRLAVAAHTTLGELDAAQALLDAPHSAQDSAGHIAHLESLLHLRYLQEDVQGALEVLEQLAPLLEGSGDALRAAHLRSNRAMLRSEAGDLLGALEDSRDATARYLALGAVRFALEDHAKLGAILTDLGRYQEAEIVLLEGLAAVSRTSNLTERGKAEWTLAALYLEWRPPHGSALARRYSRAAVRSTRAGCYAPSVAQALAIDARVEAHLGTPDVALQRAQQATEAAARCGGLPVVSALATFARGLALIRLDRPQEAAAALQTAQATVAERGLKTLAHRVGAELDILTGDEDTARRRLREVEALKFAPAADRLRQTFPGLTTAAPAPVRLLALGSMRLQRGDQETAIRGRLARKLLGLLLLARLQGRSSVPRLALIDALYPGEPEPEAVAALHQLVYRVRGLYGAGTVMSEPDGYALGVSSDAEAFLAGGDLSLWRGPLLEDADLEDTAEAEPVRAAALERIRSERDTVQAVRVGLLLLEDEAGNDAFLSACLSAVCALGDPRRVQRIYARARRLWLALGAPLPEDVNTFLSDVPT